jgi:hypothetical protein
MKFNSQICTSREQSERLLALGLKKETADMFYSTILENDDLPRVCYENFWNSNKAIDGYIRRRCIPAWSLHRLIEMVQDVCSRITMFDSWVRIENRCMPYVDYPCDSFDNTYDNLIDCIEWLIKEGYFNKEYLV